MSATVTRLELRAERQLPEAVQRLSALLGEARRRSGLLQGHLARSGPRELVMVTVYESEASAELAGAQMRPKLGEVVGPLVTGPPDRWAGPVAASR